MDVRRILDSTEPYTMAKEHMTGLLFSLMLAAVVVVFTLIVIADAMEDREARALRAASEALPLR